MKKKLTPILVIKSFLALLFTGFIITQIFISCNGNRTTETTTANFTTDIYDSLYYPVYILDAATIMANPALRTNESEKSLILKLKFNGVSHDDTLDLELIGYPSSNHTNHGQGSDTVLIAKPKQNTEYVKLPKDLIWGNIYVNWKPIKDSILVSTGTFPRDLRPGFNHIKFIPQNHVTGMPWDPYLSFKLEVYINGNKLTVMGAGSGDSHPSPPAPPAE